MKTTGFALVTAPAAAALLLTLAGGCGGVTAALSGDGGTDGQASSGSGSGGASSGSGGSSGASSSSNSGGTSSSGVSSSSSSGGTSGSSSSGGTSGSTSGGSSSSSGTTSSSGVSSSSSSGGSSSGSDTGTLYFEQCSGSALCQSPTFDFYAGFGAANGNGNQGCTVTTSGSCSSYSCTGTAQNPVGDSAGTLTISGGSIGSAVTVMPDSSNNYEYEATGSLFSAGQTLTVSASGATVPAFGPISVVAPALPVLSAPAAASGTYTIPTTADLDVAWTGSSAGGEIIFEGAASDSTSYFTCVWSASLGEATVPQAMLTSLKGQTAGYLVFGQYAATNFSAGAYSISASALPYSGGTASFE